MPESDPKKIPRLIKALESEDSFERLGAIEELTGLTHQSFGFRFNAPAEERAAAVKRWQAWLKEQRRRSKRKSQLEVAVQMSGGVLDIGSLKKAIEEIPAEKIQGYLHALISKMKAQQVRCQACHSRPATVGVTELSEGRYRNVQLCEMCAKERGDVIQ